MMDQQKFLNVLLLVMLPVEEMMMMNVLSMNDLKLVLDLLMMEL
jgi:hypothetical protein